MRKSVARGFMVVLVPCVVACSHDGHGSSATDALPMDSGVTTAMDADDVDATQVLDATHVDASALAVSPCDGSDKLRFAIRVTQGSPSFEPSLMRGVGTSYIYVLGNCRYWVNRNVGQWNRTYEGVLTSEQAQQLSDDFDYQLWSTFPPWSTRIEGPSNGAMEGSNGRDQFVCQEGCETFAPQPRHGLDKLADANRKWLPLLVQGGTEVRGALRVLARQLPRGPNPADAQSWPFIWQGDSLINSDELQGVVVDGDRAAELRMFFAQEQGDGGYGSPSRFGRYGFFLFWDLRQPQYDYYVWFRDLLPFEQADGTILLKEP